MLVDEDFFRAKWCFHNPQVLTFVGEINSGGAADGGNQIRFLNDIGQTGKSRYGDYDRKTYDGMEWW